MTLLHQLRFGQGKKSYKYATVMRPLQANAKFTLPLLVLFRDSKYTSLNTNLVTKEEKRCKPLRTFVDSLIDCSSLPEPPVETTTIIVETVLSSTPDFKSQTPSIPRGQQSSSTSPHLLHQIERSQPDASAAKVSSTPSSLSVLQDNYSSPTILIEPSAGVLQPVSTPSPQSLTSKSSSQIITQVPTFTDLPTGLSDPTLLSFQPKPQRQKTIKASKPQSPNLYDILIYTAKKVSGLRLHYFRSHGFRQSSIALHILSHDAILSISQPSQEISTTHNNSSLQPTKEIFINQNTSTLQSDQNRSS
ncbi:hypothetical protein NPIL_223141 [Nephila pilipes]|uniref:Uncharacterized protein n=1 Tax=Nephila pilipes TaxID=299642 RepID=A0A8X6QTM1_NEPPI|nr:hypothetical protein NPIL_223141 [Nephila pilipes]